MRFFLIILLSFTVAISQDEEFDTALKPDRTVSGLYAYAGFQPALLGGELTYLSEAGLIVYLTNDFKIGAAASSMTISNIRKDFLDPNTNTRPYISLTDFKPVFAYEIFENDKRLFNISLMPTLSFLTMDVSEREYENGSEVVAYVPVYDYKWIFGFEPKIDYTFKLARYLHFGFGVSYKYYLDFEYNVNGIENATIDQNDLNGVSTNIHIKLGVFEK